MEWTTGPKQRPNQWLKPPFITLDTVLPTRYCVGVDPDGVLGQAKGKRIGLVALDPERIGKFDAISYLDLGDRAFPNFQNTQQSSTCGVTVSTNNVLDDDDEEEELKSTDGHLDNSQINDNLFTFLKEYESGKWQLPTI